MHSIMLEMVEQAKAKGGPYKTVERETGAGQLRCYLHPDDEEPEDGDWYKKEWYLNGAHVTATIMESALRDAGE